MEKEKQKKFSHRYKLLKDIPTHKAGRIVKWHGDNERFYFYVMEHDWMTGKGQRESIYLDLEGPKFTLEEVQNHKWFEPEGEEIDFVPPFPSKKQIQEYFHLLPEARLVNDVDECRAINKMLEHKDFQDRLYKFYKSQYNAFYSL